MKASLNHRLSNFLSEVKSIVTPDRIYTDELRRLTYGTDAGFYRLTPQAIVRSTSEQEVAQLLSLASKYQIAVTFRAAGTSLSGQAISDSVLIVAGKHWEKYSIAPNLESITMQPGIIGERVNQILKPYGKRFAPDPASLKSAMVGGIVMNNASGMCCGTHANSDRILLSARIVLYDGTVLDTASDESRKAFLLSHPAIIDGITALRDKILTNQDLVDRIQSKYSIKNVMGLNLLPFILYTDPFEILLHLMVGSEGTLAFLSEVTMRTVDDEPFKASAMLYFDDIREACRAVVAMRNSPVAAAELLDKQSLKAANDTTGEGLTAILTEIRAQTNEDLERNISTVTSLLESYNTVRPVRFTANEKEYAPYWAIRSGIFPSVGGMRPIGTTCLIEDVAFPLVVLPEATAELQNLLQEMGYNDACIYGHALEGNYHFIINQAFDTDEAVNKYEQLMESVIQLVVDKYKGSLKAEHGTGRNMAPYVAYEWGNEAFLIMKEIKQLFDPIGILNPGVIFNEDPTCHIKHLKTLPNVDPIVDRCIECGFCEVSCLTCGLTLSSRQRIVAHREIARLRSLNPSSPEADRLEKQYDYLGNQTCIADGLCAQTCPMKINMGSFTHLLRNRNCPPNTTAHKIGSYVARHFSGSKQGLRLVLRLANGFHSLIGTQQMLSLTTFARNASFRLLPQWNTAMPGSRYQPNTALLSPKASNTINSESSPNRVVYFPSCINQTMGASPRSQSTESLVETFVRIIERAGYEVIFPKQMERLCCGTIWESKGMEDIAEEKTRELDNALWEASNGGEYPVVCDQSPCLYRMRNRISRMPLYDSTEFIYRFLLDKLTISPIDTTIALHLTCSTRKMGIGAMLEAIARRCASNVVLPEEVGCCGFGGDKGFTHPEVNSYALRKLRTQIEKSGATVGYSNSRTCEIGLTSNSGISYQSIVYLVDQCSS